MKMKVSEGNVCLGAKGRFFIKHRQAKWLRLTKQKKCENVVDFVFVIVVVVVAAVAYYIAVEKEEWKMEVLLDLYSNLDINQALIYCNTKKRVLELEKKMNENDFTVSAMHGEMD